MKPTVLSIVIVLALLATGAIFYGGNALTPIASAPVEQTYANELYGISFSYPAGYLLAEDDVGTVDRTHHVITIIKEEDAVPRVNSEGPTAITFDFYQNDHDPVSLIQWLSTPESNLALGDGTYASTTVSGIDAVRYTWSGLYQGETIALLHEGDIITVSVTYMSPGDQIKSDFASVLDSVRLR